MQDGDDGRSGDKCIGRRKGGASEVGREIELRCGKDERKNWFGNRASLPPSECGTSTAGRIHSRLSSFRSVSGVRSSVPFTSRARKELKDVRVCGAGGEEMELVGGRNCLGGDLWNLWRNKRGYFLERRRER